MRVLPIFAGLTLLALSPAWADDQDKQEIKRLQERLDLVEAKLSVLLAAQEPAPSVAPPLRTQNVTLPPSRSQRETTPPELIPEIGKIGAEVGIVLSGSANPFHLNKGQDAAGFIDLPLFEPTWAHGKISYEIRAGLSQAKTKFQTTSNVAQIANLAALTALQPANVGQNLADAVNGTGAAPFPVSTLTETNSKVLQLVPFSLKYTFTALDRLRIRPYAVLGFGMYVTIHRETALGSGIRLNTSLSPEIMTGLQQVFGGTAPFGAPLAAGQISQSAELTTRGLPIGAGNIDFGLHGGGGVEFRVSRNFSLGFDGRYNRLSGGQTLGTYGTRLGFHF